MKDSEERELIRTAKNKAVSVVVGAFLLGAFTITIFYFTSTNTMAQHTAQIKNLEGEVKKVTTVPVLNQSEITNIKKDVARIEHKQEENHKENKAAISDLRRQNLKILELLYQIKQQN